ncbi:MAG: AI-2E family transporter [Verrucomicrobia bacterium]|nr:AI-2E family transporter [Verrucomicrobiota bacterium]
MEVDRNKIIVPFLAILTIIAVGMVLKVAQTVVLPLIIAWLLSYILGPAINALTNRKVPTALATTAILTVMFCIFYFIGVFILGRAFAIASEYPKYQVILNTMIMDIKAGWRYDWDPMAGVDWANLATASLGKVAATGKSFVTNLLMVIIFLVFLLLGKPYFKFKLRKALTLGNADRVESVVSAIAGQISRYLYFQFLISFATGLLVWIALTLLKVDFAITWGVLAFFLNFIPTIGSIVASVPPILLALVQFYPLAWPAVATAVALLTIQMVIGNGVAPKVMGDKLNLSPVVVLLSLIFWGWLWGIVGALLSIPIAAAIKIVCENIEPLRPLSIMMGSGKSYQHEFAKDRTA